MTRHPQNPIITKGDFIPEKGREVIGAFNAGAADYNGETVLLVRVAERFTQTGGGEISIPSFDPVSGKTGVLSVGRNDPGCDFSDPRIIKVKDGRNLLTSVSKICLARSRDGINFKADGNAVISAFDKYTAYGVEDPRVTKIGDTYYICFFSASAYGITARLMATEDFAGYRDMGVIFHPDNKDVTIFPEKIGGMYYALHRPSSSGFGGLNIWIASSPDLVRWGDHRAVAETKDSGWDSGRIGAGCVPFLTEKGWVEIYHGADKNDRYCLGALLLDAEKPWEVLARTEEPILEPLESFETGGFFGGVVFSCGHVRRGELIRVYYGAGDDCVCAADTTLGEIYAALGV